MATEDQRTKDSALRYIERGFRVIPLHTSYNGICSCGEGRMCKSSGKHPIRAKWQTANQPGLPAIDNWWTGDKPRNIGVATGPDSGVFVVDVDPDSGGDESMKALNAEHGREWMMTYRVKTGSGGWHLYFNYPDFELGNSASKIGKGIDTRGKGGYVVTAPSVSSKGPYIEHDHPVLDAPEWLLELLRPKQRKAPEPTIERPTVTQGSPEQQRLDGYTTATIDNEVGRLHRLAAEGWDGAPWDSTTYEVACNLLELANADWSYLEPEQAEALVFDNAPRDPGFDAGRVSIKIESARNKVGDNATGYPAKPEAAFWLDAEDAAELAPAPVKPEASTSADEADSFDSFVTSEDADEAPEPATIQVGAALQGIPVHDGKLVPDYVKLASAAALGLEYSEREHVEVIPADFEAPLSAVIKTPDLPTEEGEDMEHVDDWVAEHLRTGTPELLWAAVGTIIEGTDTAAPYVVFKGGAPLLVLLARILKPHVGDQGETLLAGPRYGTKEVDEPQVVFEFSDGDMDLMPHAHAIVQRAAYVHERTPLRAFEIEHTDGLEDVTDYRAAQLIRARQGLGSRPRSDDEEVF